VRARKRDCRGAFLLEALLAVFIMSVALVGLIRGLMTSLNAAVEAEKYTGAIVAANNALLEMVRLNGQKVTAPVLLENQVDKITAKFTINPSDNIQIPPSMQQAQLTVAWPGKLKEKKIEAITLIFGSVDEKK